MVLSSKDGFLSVRILLEINEELLSKYGFKDVWKHQKENENLRALKMLHNRLKEIDSIAEPEHHQVNRRKWEELFRGVLAGNIFDSGATAVQSLLADNESFGLSEALQKIQSRPWLVDNFDQFMKRLERVMTVLKILFTIILFTFLLQGSPHRCAAVFCDNSGVDIVLGVIPFVRELLSRNTNVILVANTSPSLNDVTYHELVDIIERATEVCSILKENYLKKRLVCHKSGQKGCCLDFLKLDE